MSRGSPPPKQARRGCCSPRPRLPFRQGKGALSLQLLPEPLRRPQPTLPRPRSRALKGRRARQALWQRQLPLRAPASPAAGSPQTEPRRPPVPPDVTNGRPPWRCGARMTIGTWRATGASAPSRALMPFLPAAASAPGNGGSVPHVLPLILCPPSPASHPAARPAARLARAVKACPKISSPATAAAGRADPA